MGAKKASTIAGRIDLSQAEITLPDGRAAGFWALAPVASPAAPLSWTEEAYRWKHALRAVPAEHREAVWAVVEGQRWPLWAMIDVRTGRALAAHTFEPSYAHTFLLPEAA